MTASDRPVDRYIGSELPLFLEAQRFHQYYLDLFGKWISGSVLEIGAGQGAITHRLLNCKPRRLTACEPDPGFVAVLRERFGIAVEIVQGGLADVPAAAGPFDAIVYVDVLEHIRNDRDEVRRDDVRPAPRRRPASGSCRRARHAPRAGSDAGSARDRALRDDSGSRRSSHHGSESRLSPSKPEERERRSRRPRELQETISARLLYPSRVDDAIAGRV